VLELKRIIKISLVVLVLGSFILAQNTQGTIQVSVGDQVKFKVLKNEISVEFGASHFPFLNYNLNFQKKGFLTANYYS